MLAERCGNGVRGGRARRVVSVLTVFAVVGTMSAARVSAAAAASVPLSEGQKALAAAKRSGHRVEVAGQRTERTTVYANPDGFSFRLEESAVPVRVPKPGGGWRAPDPTLVRRADGSVAPRAAAVAMSFSGGGKSAALVAIADGGRSLSLRWPGRLPEPEVDGTAATYPDVLPGVDLKVTASSEGFREVLVVKTPKAAADPKLKRLDFAMKSNGLTVRGLPGGGLAAVDAVGRTVFRAPPALMWDSAGRTRPPAAEKAGQRPLPGSGDVSKAGAGDVPGSAPVPGDVIKKMVVKTTKSRLSVIPDAGTLAKTPESAFPLFIDPTVTWGESERTLLRSDGYEDYAWGNGSDGEGEGAGHCGTWNGYYCGPGYTQRLYFEFSPSSLKGKKVLDATFRVTEPWAFQCDPRWVDLERTNNISSSTTWGSRPAELDLMVDRNVSAGRGSLCDPNESDAPIEFNDNPDESNENLTPTVANFAAGKFSRLTLELRAHDETDTSAWKRFKNDAVLAVDFVGLPAKPTGIGLVEGSDTICEANESDPATVTDPTPALTATPQTMSGGESGAQLRVYFDVDEKNADGSWSDSTAGNGSLVPSTGFVGDGTKLTMSWSTLSEGKLYRYRAWTRSYYDNQSDYIPGPSNASTTGWCYFKVDTTAPKAPSIAVSGPYSECTATSCVAAGGPGTKAVFSLSAASGDSNVTAFEWKLSSSASWSSEITGPTASATVTPQHSGTYRLYVRAKDVTGRWGAQNVFDFLVAAGAGPIAQWHFDEDGGAALDAVTSDGVSSDATLGAGAVRDDRGRRGVITHDASGALLATPVVDKGLSLDGSGAYAATSGPVLETRSPYTVSAWARLGGRDSDRIVLSQDGDHYSEFILAYLKSYDTWLFGVKKQDLDDGTAYFGVRAKQPAVVNAWTHLAATYDPQSEQASLYVNGEFQGTVTVPGSWSATHGFNIGRYLWAGNRYYGFNGSIDEVSVWQRELTAEEISEQASLKLSQSYSGVELVGAWDPAAGSGTTIPDPVSGYGRNLTLTGGASLNNGEIVLDGQDDAATTPDPVVDDIGSFTATAAVALDSAALVSKPVGYTGQVIGQRTGDGSSWGFWFELTGTDTKLDPDTGQEKTVPVGLWHFGRLGGDASESVASDQVAELDATVRLTGVFDAQAGTISLYLGHNQNGDDQVFTAKAGTGEFAAGKGYTSSAWGHYLPARISDVRLWAGAMASSDQVSEVVGD